MGAPPVLGLILAGGQARRMGGGDKPLLRLAGRTLLDRVAERLAPQCAAGLALSANGDPARFGGFPGPVLPDPVPGQPGPLAGILAGLEHAAARGIAAVVSVSGDAPFLPHDLVARPAALWPSRRRASASTTPSRSGRAGSPRRYAPISTAASAASAASSWRRPPPSPPGRPSRSIPSST